MIGVSGVIFRLSLIAGLGYLLCKKKVIDDRILQFLTFFVIYFSVPCLIFSHLIKNAGVIFSYPLWMFIFLSTVIFIVGALAGKAFYRNKTSALAQESVILVAVQNAGYLPLNIALLLFSSEMRNVFFVYIFLHLLGFNVIMWSIGSFFILKKSNEQFKYRTLFTPPVAATLLALSFVYANIGKVFPILSFMPVEMVGETSFVLSMIILGCDLAKTDIHNIKARARLLCELSVLKLIVVPAVVLCAIILLKLYSPLGLFIILQAAMPSAASLPIVARLRGADSGFISQGVLVTHLFSVITIPLWLGIFLKISGISL